MKENLTVCAVKTISVCTSTWTPAWHTLQQHSILHRQHADMHAISMMTANDAQLQGFHACYGLLVGELQCHPLSFTPIFTPKQGKHSQLQVASDQQKSADKYASSVPKTNTYWKLQIHTPRTESERPAVDAGLGPAWLP